MEHEQSLEFEVRQATLNDIEAIRRMHAQSWLDTYPSEDENVPEDWVKQETDKWLTPEGFEQSRQHFSSVFGNPDHFYRIAMDGDTVIGLVHGLREEGHVHLGALYVAQSYHGRGVAQRLMDEVNLWFGNDDVDLEVVSYNARAIKFYEKYDFSIVDSENDKYKDVMPTVKMVRKGDEQ